MEIIRANAEIWEQGNGLENLWKHIARCTRVCYQSTPKNNGETDEEFVKRVILKYSSTGELDFNKIHGAMLEHGTVYLYICPDERDKFIFKDKYEHNKYSKVNYFIDITGNIIKDSPLFITTNLRVIYENNWLEDLDFIDANPSSNYAKKVTVSFITNIGVTREFNRHRVNSIAEESTRYCNYNKRNDGQIKIALPAWLDNETNKSYLESHQFDSLNSYCEEILNDNNDINTECWCDIDFYLFALTAAEFSYNKLIEKGWKPQQAREVLPLATKTQLIHTAFIDDWKHFFALRADGVSGSPHPNAALVAKPLKEEFIKRNLI